MPHKRYIIGGLGIVEFDMRYSEKHGRHVVYWYLNETAPYGPVTKSLFAFTTHPAATEAMQRSLHEMSAPLTLEEGATDGTSSKRSP